MKTKKEKMTWVVLFSIAMGLLETAVVVYLRKLYYPDGFAFPLKIIPTDIAVIEVSREAATLLMLIAIGKLAGKKGVGAFAYFLLSFAVWDLVYYLFLKIFLNWPESWSTWDILFLIPVPWVGPVWAPCLLSFCMIVLAVVLLHKRETSAAFRLNWRERSALLLGSSWMIYSFVLDYLQWKEPRNKVGNALFADFSSYVPSEFHWFPFLVGLLLMVSGILLIYRRNADDVQVKK